MVRIDSWWDGNVRDRSSDILQLVLAAISDDYTNVGMILESINQMASDWSPEAWPARRAVPVSRQEVIHALRELAREGLARAFRLETGTAQPARFDEERARDLWFCATPQGSEAIRRLLEKPENETDH